MFVCRFVCVVCACLCTCMCVVCMRVSVFLSVCVRESYPFSLCDIISVYTSASYTVMSVLLLKMPSPAWMHIRTENEGRLRQKSSQKNKFQIFRQSHASWMSEVRGKWSLFHTLIGEGGGVGWGGVGESSVALLTPSFSQIPAAVECWRLIRVNGLVHVMVAGLWWLLTCKPTAQADWPIIIITNNRSNLAHDKNHNNNNREHL